MLGKLLADSKTLAVALERAREIALCALQVADVVVADGEIALPVYIARVMLGKLLGNSKTLAVALERTR